MAGDASFDELLREWRRLAAGDRKAVLHNMPVERRRALQRVLAENGEPAEQAAPYRAYSPWLGELIEDCVNGEPGETALKPRTRSALVQAHREAEEELGGKPENLDLLGLAHATFRKWRAKL
jgi:hypothetical protein